MRVTKCRHKSDSTLVGLSKVNPEDLRWDIIIQVWSEKKKKKKLVQCQKALLLSIARHDNFMSHLFFFFFFCSVQSANPLQFNSFVISTLTDLTPWEKKKEEAYFHFSVKSVVFTVLKSVVVLHNYVNVAIERSRGNASISL